MPLPAGPVTEPVLAEHLVGVYAAFLDLAGERPIGPTGLPGAVSFAALDRYAERYGFADFEAFHLGVRALDDEWLKLTMKRAENDGRSR